MSGHRCSRREEENTVEKTLIYFLSFVTGSLIHEHYTRECEFGNFDKNKKTKTTQKNKSTQKLLAEFLFK